MTIKSAIMQMYYGERGNYELTPFSEAYRERLKTYVLNDEKFRKALPPDLLELHKKTTASLEALHAESVENNYLEGFRFGFLMGLDVVSQTPQQNGDETQKCAQS
jgi:hypothetical protein